jgi:hypothetical protein
MRLTRGDVRDHIVSSKIDHGPSSGIEKPHSRRDVQKSTFARFVGLIDFRLLQQYRHFSDVTDYADDVRSWGQTLRSIRWNHRHPSKERETFSHPAT